MPINTNNVAVTVLGGAVTLFLLRALILERKARRNDKEAIRQRNRALENRDATDPAIVDRVRDHLAKKNEQRRADDLPDKLTDI